MKKRILILSSLSILTFFSAYLIAQNTTQISLSDSDRATYWKRQYELSLSNCQGDKSVAAWNLTLVELSKKCGLPEGTINIPLDSNGEPSCPKIN